MHSKEQILLLLALEQFLAILPHEPQDSHLGSGEEVDLVLEGECKNSMNQASRKGHFLGRDGTSTTSTRLPMHHQLQPFEPQFKCGSWEQHRSKPVITQEEDDLILIGTSCASHPPPSQAGQPH
ncbi:hypothetical protein PAL_GLEAN10012051 [Pteropus alecto]|uniref:SCAN box domain-containing protein n=1 Tax=Pteropus alecto TaxID=9402 RepID=L5K6D7_PTEAL|nr:hypothetical protein PAL_GLEAN10012051 [Pteropus alecto]